MTDIIYKITLPSPEEFQTMRHITGWGEVSREHAEAALNGSLGGICAYDDDRLIGIARFVGDGTLIIYIQDVIVAADYRKRGIATELMRHLITHLKARHPAGCTIGLMAATGQEKLYAQFGFISRPSGVYGAGMIAPLGELKAESKT